MVRSFSAFVLLVLAICTIHATADDQKVIIRCGTFECNDPAAWYVGGDDTQYPYVDWDVSQCKHAVLPFVNGVKTTLSQKFLLFGEGDEIEIKFRYRLTNQLTTCEEAVAWVRVVFGSGDSTSYVNIDYPDDTNWTDFLVDDPPTTLRLDRTDTDVMGFIEFGTFFCDESNDCNVSCSLELCIDNVEICFPQTTEPPQDYDEAYIDTSCDCWSPADGPDPLEKYSGIVMQNCPVAAPCEWTWDDDIVTDVTAGDPYNGNTNTGECYRVFERFASSEQCGHWYRITGTGFKLTASLCPGDPWAENYIFLSVFRRLPDDFNLLENDDPYEDCTYSGQEIEWDSESGIEYFIFVFAWDTQDSGPYTLTVSEDQGGT